MKTYVSSLIILLLTLVISNINLFSLNDNDELTDWSNNMQDVVEELKATQNVSFPDRLLQFNVQRRNSDFNVSEYFSALKHLSMEPGYTLDYVYYYDEMQGYPILYARSTNQNRFLTFEQFNNQVTEDQTQWFKHVVCDGSKESYLELVLLVNLASQFYLFWHAGFDDTQFVLCNEKLDQILNRGTDRGIAFTQSQINNALAIDIIPSVRIEEDRVIVRTITFSNWVGFSEVIYTISKNFPHEIISVTPEVLVSYDCGWIY